ncbi:Scr1 family TA system antitoxin-like transcriptional regulator [Streptomyces sp. NPDC002742]|uniref:Scr1 family TA system antitoxin-like transcriptional regulator n=1 Tax=Streptomyces sp. NPDC002742 TaxID=3364663 RepID=UPI0036A53A84
MCPLLATPLALPRAKARLPCPRGSRVRRSDHGQSDNSPIIAATSVSSEHIRSSGGPDEEHTVFRVRLGGPSVSETAYTEGAHYGQLVEDSDEVRSFALAYDRLRAAALPPLMSLDMIRSTMEGNYRGANVPSRSERRRLAQEQLQQSGGGRLRGGGRPVPRGRRPGP